MDDLCIGRRPFIGDDWVFDEILLDDAEGALDLSGLTLGAIYFAPPGTTPAEVDVSSAIAAVPGTPGRVRAVVSKAITSQIQSLPAGRKRAPGHLQIFVTDANGLRTTKRVLILDPVDPSTVAPCDGDRDPGVYRRLRGFGYPTLIF